MSFETERSLKGGQWRFDFTQHFVGKQRLLVNREDFLKGFSVKRGCPLLMRILYLFTNMKDF